MTAKCLVVDLGIKIRSVDFSKWYNSSIEKLKSFNEEIESLSDILSARMVFGCSFTITGNFVENTEGTVIYRGKTYRIPEQRLRKPKNGEYIYISDVMAGTLALSTTKRDVAMARFVGGSFDYSVRDYRFSASGISDPSEGMMVFDQSKKCFAVYHSGSWLYERRSSLIFSCNYSGLYDAGVIGTFASMLPEGTVKLVLSAGFEHADDYPEEHIYLKRDGDTIIDCDLYASSDHYTYESCEIESTGWSVYEIETTGELEITSMAVSAIFGE